MYGIKLFELYQHTKDHSYTLRQLIDAGFYEVLVSDARRKGHLVAAKVKPCELCGNKKPSQLWTWKGGPPALWLGSMGKANANKVRLIAHDIKDTFGVFVKRKDNGFAIEFKRPKGKYVEVESMWSAAYIEQVVGAL